MARKSIHPIVLAGATICAVAAAPAHAEAPTIVKGVCFPTGETREEIKAHRLLEPFVALKSAEKAVGKAEALSAKLCRLAGEEYVYEIALLHRDGRLVHVVMNAVTGKLINTRISREAPPRT
jgi:peptidase YpeB-like protein